MALAVGLLVQAALLPIGTGDCLAAEPTGAGGLKSFMTDGCSLFPDRALIGRGDWCGCCVAHDLAYWRGGTSEARLLADKALRACVARVTGNEALAELMYEGVRAGGGPYFYTSYRWGYGWPDRHSYRPLSTAESTLADHLEQDYRAREPMPSCPSSESNSGG